jgi:hypothetical protein
MSLFDFLKKPRNDLTFVDTFEVGAWKHYPIKLAKDCKPLKECQTKKFNEYFFPGCPGMHDFARLGYIIPSWTIFSFKANKAGCVAITGGKRGTKYETPKPMDVRIADGAFTYFDGIPPNVWNLPSPWKIVGTPELTAIILPAVYHNKTLNDDLFIYPGAVDYPEFNTMNVICSVKRSGEFIIQENEPLLQVIPIKMTAGVNAEYGLATKEEITATTPGKYFNRDGFYRKYFMLKKKFTLTHRKHNNE